ncbi:YgaP family membrane protein [Paenibacillus ehimensis]|uniref:YgaP family membrane protein n=1 Tax=Paenibacillus ehimensis TaxID=79264 RepID=UPI000FDA10C2|nr:DUF2892 domain-containing protein [Paenibacillus ehimensis]MEC0208030.1 DUF2892 domain-containing protein [Paenibacillus ehimensis]
MLEVTHCHREENHRRFDLVFRIVAGLALLSLLFLLEGEIKYLGLIGIPLLYTALTRKCLINRLLGINSCKL